MDLRDPELLERLHALLGALPEVVCAFLDALVFPETMHHQLMRLSASGQVGAAVNRVPHMDLRKPVSADSSRSRRRG